MSSQTLEKTRMKVYISFTKDNVRINEFCVGYK